MIEEKKMKKMFLTLASSAVIALSAVHFAAAAEHHSGRVHHHAHAGFRDSNAYAVPAYRVPQQPDWDRYSGYAGIDGH
jgi:hypothetical protein